MLKYGLGIADALFAAPREEGVFVVDLDKADGGLVGVTMVRVFVFVSEQIARVLLVGGDQVGMEQVDDLVVAELVAVRPVVGAAPGARDMEIQVRINAARFEGVDKVIEPIQRLGRERLQLPISEDAARKGR